MRYLNQLVWAAFIVAATATPAFAQGGTGGGAGAGGFGGGGGVGGGGGLGGGGGGLGGGGTGGAGGGGSGGLGGSSLGGTSLQGLTSAPNITAAGTTGGSGGSALSSSNFLGPTYANPYYQGRAGAALTDQPGGFGAALYGTSGNTGGGSIGYAGGAVGASGGRGGVGGGLGRTAAGSSTAGSAAGGILVPLPVQISYRAETRFAVPQMPNTQLQRELSGMLARSTMISNPANFQVITEGNVVTLRGTAKDEEEARLIESLVRLTPGVRGLKNEITFPQP